MEKGTSQTAWQAKIAGLCRTRQETLRTRKEGQNSLKLLES